MVSESDQTPPDAHVCTDQAHTETILQAVSIYCTLTQGMIFLLMYVQRTLYNRHNSSVSLYSVYIIQSCILPMIPSMMMWCAINKEGSYQWCDIEVWFVAFLSDLGPFMVIDYLINP